MYTEWFPILYVLYTVVKQSFITHFFLMQMDSRLHSDNLEKVLDVAVKGCSRVHTILDHAVKDNLERSSSSFAF